MEMRSGALVPIETSVNIAYGYDIRGEIVGETGVVTLAERNTSLSRANGVFTGRVPADWSERFGSAFDAEFREWIAAAAKAARPAPAPGTAMSPRRSPTPAPRRSKSGERVAIKLRERPTLYRAA